MFRRSIAFVFGKTVFGILLSLFRNPPVARHLGHDGGRGDALAAPIASDHRFLRHAVQGRLANRPYVQNELAIDEEIVGTRSQRFDRQPHRLEGGLMDVDPIDLARIHGRNGPSDRLAPDHFKKTLSELGFQFLGIVDIGKNTSRRKNHGRRKHGTCQTTPSDFIHAGDPQNAPRDQAAFERQEIFRRLRNLFRRL